MIILGVVALILGFILSIHFLWILGIILVVLGLILNLVPLGGSTRRWY